MLIRSQDKKTIFDMSGCCIGIISKNKEKYICIRSTCNPSEKYWVLGKYPTTALAIKVMDDICNLYVSLNEYRNNDLCRTGLAKNGVYQMPEV